MNSGQSKGKIIMKPKKRLQAPTQKKSQQDQNTPEQKGDIPTPKVITEPSQERKQEIPPSRMTFSGGSRGTFQKNSSENTSSQDNGAPVTIKPKVNNTSSIKAPLKNFGKKSETKKNDGKKSEKSPLKERKLKGRHTAKRSLANIPTKGDKIINIETIEPADDIVTRKSENNFIKLEELKENDPELTPNSNLELDSDEAKKGYNTARNQPNTRIEIINKKQKKAKDTIGNKLKKAFGMKKPSQQKEAKSLACSFVGSNTKPKIKTKVNQTLVDYNGTKSVKKVKQKNTQSFLTRPQSTLKQPKTSPKKNRGHAKVSDLMDSDDDSS
mmetsp:Transcript_33713/g.33206  ORF Transcript_33713/g.33206 Transcript_33713/m.33206 type:complete len:326 (-) Transcript_33713:166-1143(-)